MCRTGSRDIAKSVAVAAVMLAIAMSTGSVQGQQPAPVTTTSPMDEPLRLVAAAAKTYERVQDYTCLFIKKERINGQLQADNLISMKVRTRPFSVYMQWLGPQDVKGQEVCYVAGKNDGMMRIHPAGRLRGALGFLSIDPNDPRVKENSRHAITEAGIGHLIDAYSKRWSQEKAWNQTRVSVADYEYAKRQCRRVEMVHPANGQQYYPYYRSVVYFDKQTTLPIRVENYDYPRNGGSPGGDLAESYSYVQMRFNASLRDSDFDR